MTAQMTKVIEAVWERSKDQTVGRIETVEEAVGAMLDNRLDEELRARAEREAHKLAGSLGMFGFPRGTDLARKLERALEAPVYSEAPHLAELVLALSDEIESQPATSDTGGDDEDSLNGSPGVLLVSPDSDLVERLSLEAIARHLRPISAATAADARELAAGENPAAAVLDVSFADGDTGGGLALIEFFAGCVPPVSVVALTGSEALVDRVEVARRGGGRFVQRTRAAARVIDAVSEAIERRDVAQATVLAVDDDPVVLEVLRAELASCGFAITTLNDPLLFWEVLTESTPTCWCSTSRCPSWTASTCAARYETTSDSVSSQCCS